MYWTMLWVTLWGCAEPTECGVTECAEICADAAPAPTPPEAPAPAAAPDSKSAGMSKFEAELLGPVLEDVREGVRPFNAEGIGVCRGGGKECEEYLGTSPGELPAGEYMLRAELAVPKTGEKGQWKIDFHVECTRTKKTGSGETSTTTNQDRSYDLIYAGKDRGYRLQPLRKIDSPGKYGAEDCKYKLTAPHPDGDKVYTGSWMVPEGA